MRRAPIWEQAFLEALVARRGEIKAACEFSGAPRSSVYKRMREDHRFRSRVRLICAGQAHALASERTRLTRMSLGLVVG